MKILLIHNYYQQLGGEDQVFKDESKLLKDRGHEVVRYAVHNEDVCKIGKIDLAIKSIWSREQYQRLRNLLRREHPDVAHFHNTLPLISPAGYWGAKAENVAVVQTLHNYRLICPGSLFFRNAKPCEDCKEKFIPWPAVIHACYRQSRSATAVVAGILIIHRLLRTWKDKVDVFIALSDFSRRKFIQARFPIKQIEVKPNFIEVSSKLTDLTIKSNVSGHLDEKLKNRTKREGALFVGRLSWEKGIETLLLAMKNVGPHFHLTIAGDGPLAPLIRTAGDGDKRISWLGRQCIQEVYRLMFESKVVVFPSVCYEAFPLVIIESFAMGTPVIVSKIGALSEIVDHGSTGLHFTPGDADDLAKKMNWADSHPEEMELMGQQARLEYLNKYSPEINYRMLMAIYHKAIDIHRTRSM